MVRNHEVASSPLKEIARDVLFYIPGRLVPVITGFLGVAAYTHLLGPKEYGLYTLISITISFVHAFGFTWVGYIIWRYFEKYKNEQHLPQFLSTVGTILAILFLVVALLWYLVTIFYSQNFEPHFTSLLTIGILVLGAQVGFNMALTILRVNRQSFRYSVYTSVNALGTLLLAVGLIYFSRWGAEGILWASIIFMGGLFALEFRQFYRKWRISPFYFSSSLLRKLAGFGLPQIGISVGALILSIFDRYMIEAFRSTEEVGIYSASYTVADMGIQIPLNILMLAALPVIVQTFEKKGEEKTRLLFKRLFSLYMIILVPAVFGIATLSQEIVGVVLGRPFHSAAVILPWVAGGSFLFGFSQYSNTPFQLKAKPLLLLYLIVMAAILNIALNFILIPPLGILGAAYATFIAYFVYVVISYVIINRIFPLFFPWQTLTRSVLASIGMYGILQLGIIDLTPKMLNLMLHIALGAFSYFIMLMFLKEQTLWVLLRYMHRSLKSRLNLAKRRNPDVP